MGYCVICGKATKGNRKTCSAECLHKRHSQTMARTNKEYASDRMLKNNPMRNAETREKVSKTLKKIGHKPCIQGGNGKPMPIQQQMLLEKLEGLGFVAECAVPTKMGRYSGYPTCYKIDLGNPQLKLGIEIDGNSHCSIKRQEQDKKKTDLLATLGWQVLRFKNKEVSNGLNQCMDQIMSTILKLKKQTHI